MSWKKTITTEEVAPVESKSSWRNTIQEAPPEGPNELDSAARGLAQGASMGFADELSGGVEALWNKAKGDPAAFGDLYQKYRDESRQNFKTAEEANPKSYMAGQVGGAVATAAIPGTLAAKGLLGAGKLAQAANAVNTIGGLAAQGAAQGLGSSEAEDLAGMAKDAAIGAGTGAAIGAAGKALASGASKVIPKITTAVEDLATAPLGNKAAEANMGAISNLASKSTRAGNAVDDAMNSMYKAIAPKTGNDAADALVTQAARRGAYAIPGVGKLAGAVDAAAAGMQVAPKVAQKAAMLTAETLPAMMDKLGKYGPVLQRAAERGGTSLAATDFVLQQQDPEYRKIKQQIENPNEQER